MTELLDFYISSSAKFSLQALKSHYVICVNINIFICFDDHIRHSSLGLLNEFSVIEIDEGTLDTEALNYYAVSCLFTLLS